MHEERNILLKWQTEKSTLTNLFSKISDCCGRIPADRVEGITKGAILTNDSPQ